MLEQSDTASDRRCIRHVSSTTLLAIFLTFLTENAPPDATAPAKDGQCLEEPSIPAWHEGCVTGATAPAGAGRCLGEPCASVGALA